MKVSTLRGKGFSIVQLAGPVTHIVHKQPFTVNGKPARQVSDRFEFDVRGWYRDEIPREIVLQ
jgi:hypothetical protein